MTLIDIINDTDLPESKKEILKEAIEHSSLNQFVKLVHQNAVEHGFWDKERNFGEVIALMHSELSEALEEYRNNKPAHYYIDEKPEGVAFELADVVIRVMDYFGYMGWNLEETIEKKHNYNCTRPYKHGGKKI